MGKVRAYQSEQITVQYELSRCIHAEECVHGLPDVFDKNARPWINPAAGTAEAITDVIERCPTGALHYERPDGLSEQADAINAVLLAVNGPLYVRGCVEIASPDGGSIILQDTRVALCRCGASQNKPFCDNSHLSSGFQAGDGLTAESEIEKTEVVSSSTLRITPHTNGSLHIEGAFDLKNAQGDRLDAGSGAWFCRCGGSHHKPFCDGTHKEIGFRSE